MRDGISYGAIIASEMCKKSVARTSRTAAERDEKLKSKICRPDKPDSGGKDEKLKVEIFRPVKPDGGGKGTKSRKVKSAKRCSSPP